jgi:hypothetical protein
LSVLLFRGTTSLNDRLVGRWRYRRDRFDRHDAHCNA